MKNQTNCFGFAYSLSAFLLMFSTGNSFAEQYFNPSFLSDGLSDAQVSDLAYFQNGNNIMPGIYRVDISVNGNFIKATDVEFIQPDDKSKKLFPCFDLAQLKQFGLNVEHDEVFKVLDAKDTCIAFPELIKSSSFDFDFSNQKLSISFPQAYLYNQADGYVSPDLWEEGINALFVNYNFSGNNDSDKTSSYYLNLNSGVNLGAWQFRQSSTWSHSKNEKSTKNQFRSLSNYVKRPIVAIKSLLILGDNNTASDIFDAMGFRGIRLTSSDNMYPNSQQGYAPTVHGIAKTNAKVVVQQNGYTIYQTYVSPGPFIINDLSPSSTNGDLDVIVEENDGSVQRYTIPYSALPIFQREGRIKYDLTAAEFRSGNNYQSNPKFIQATVIVGLLKGASVYAGTQLSNKYKSALIGFGQNLGQFGALSFDITHARSELADNSDHIGNSLRLLYAKSLTNLGTTFQIIGYRYSTEGFYTLSDTAYRHVTGYETIDDGYGSAPIITNYHDLRFNKKGRFQVSISQNLGKQGQYGSLYISGNQQTYWGTGKIDEWYQSGYANTWKGVSYSLSVSTNKSMYFRKRDNLISVNLSIPFRQFMDTYQTTENPLQNAYLTINTMKNSNGRENFQTGINGTLLKEKNLSYSISQGYQNKSDSPYSGSVNLSYQGAYADIGAGYNYDSNRNQINYHATGSALLHSEGITLGQSIGDTAVLVKAQDAAGISLENYTGVKTDPRGYAILPYATSYRINRIALDPNTFSDNIEVINNVETVIPIQGAIVKATFNTSIGLRALLTLDYQGKSIPFGSIATLKDGTATGIVADAGQLYITGLPPTGKLVVKWGNNTNEQCTVDYSIPEEKQHASIIKSKFECK